MSKRLGNWEISRSTEEFIHPVSKLYKNKNWKITFDLSRFFFSLYFQVNKTCIKNNTVTPSTGKALSPVYSFSIINLFWIVNTFVHRAKNIKVRYKKLIRASHTNTERTILMTITYRTFLIAFVSYFYGYFTICWN